MRYAYTASVNLRFWAGERPVNLDTVSRRAQETLARGLADQTRSRSPRGQRERPGGERSVLWGSAHHRRRWCRGCTHGVAVPLRLLHRGSLRSTEPDQESRPPERSWSTFSCPVQDHRPFVTWRGMAATSRRVAPRVVVRVANSSVGRAARIGAGLVLIAAGARAGGTMGGTLAMVGLVPLVAGALNRCVLGPLFHVPLPHIVTAGGDSR